MADITRLVGKTPLIRVRLFDQQYPNVEVHAKAEWFNPGGSVKDRPAYRMLRAAELAGTLTRDKTILDATSGNTGIAYAMVGASLGYGVTLCLPDSASHERKKILGAFGAELVITPGDEGTDGAIHRVKKMVADDPERYFYPDQYSNPANWQAHYRGTANEIWEQTGGRITHFVAGLGTSGTFVGTTRRLKELHLLRHRTEDKPLPLALLRHQRPFPLPGGTLRGQTPPRPPLPQPREPLQKAPAPTALRVRRFVGVRQGRAK